MKNLNPNKRPNLIDLYILILISKLRTSVLFVEINSTSKEDPEVYVSRSLQNKQIRTMINHSYNVTAFNFPLTFAPISCSFYLLPHSIRIRSYSLALVASIETSTEKIHSLV